MLSGQRKGEPHGHTLGDIVEGNGEDQEGGAFQIAPEPLRRPGVEVQVGEEHVQQQQEGRAQDETACGGDPAGLTGGLGLFNGGDEQGPDRGGNHHACGKAEEEFLGHSRAFSTEEKDKGRAQSGHKEGESGAGGGPGERFQQNDRLLSC